MKIVKIKGGLGNQMFQYAFGKALERKLNCEVFFDITTHYENEKHDVARRSFCLDIFPNINLKIADKSQIAETIGKKTKIPGFVRNLLHLRKFKNKIDEHGFCHFHDEWLKDLGTVYYEGYFQNEKYFYDIAEKIKYDFKFPDFKDDYNKKTYEKIINTPNAVFIHVRRSDYKPEDQLDINYYKKAVKYIADRIENPKFFVFGAECSEYIEQEFNIGYEFEFLGKNNLLPTNHFEDMRLMTAFQHCIIANSSYSWWGAWLSNFERNKRIIVTPNKWFEKSSEIICDDWVKIQAK